jgi:hypothetical protein
MTLVVEYGGKWKMLHYFAKDFFAPTLISPYKDGNDVNVFIVIDELSVKEVRHPVHHTLQFQAKYNPRPFNLYDTTTWDDNHVSASNQINLYNKDAFSGSLYIEMYSWDRFQMLYSWKIPFTVSIRNYPY